MLVLITVRKEREDNTMVAVIIYRLPTVFLFNIMKIIKASLYNKLEIINNAVMVNGKLVDPDAACIKRTCSDKINKGILGYGLIYVIDVTSNCNTKCDYCYYPITQKAKDRSIDSIIEEAILSGHNNFILMGAEPTTRVDLPEIIRKLKDLGFRVGICTNGLKLIHKDYLQELISSGLTSLSYSMHFSKEYAISRSKLQVLKNIADSKIKIMQLSFTVNTLEEIGMVLEMIKLIGSIGIKPKQFCIRAGAAIGKCTNDSNLYMSDMIKLLESEGATVIKDSGNNLYFCEMMFFKNHIHLARWPTNDTALPYSTTGPIFNTKAGPTLSPMTQIILADPLIETVELPKLLEAQDVLFK